MSKVTPHISDTAGNQHHSSEISLCSLLYQTYFESPISPITLWTKSFWILSVFSCFMPSIFVITFWEWDTGFIYRGRKESPNKFNNGKITLRSQARVEQDSTQACFTHAAAPQVSSSRGGLPATTRWEKNLTTQPTDWSQELKSRPK